MSTRPSEEIVAGIQDLIGRSQLEGIEYHEISGRLSGTDFDTDDALELNMELQLQHRCDAVGFGFRLVGEVTSEIGSVDVTVAATYSYTGEVPSQRTLFGFGNEVAVMTIFPYFRETVHSISAKVFNKPIVLQPINRGAVGYDLDDASDGPAYVPGVKSNGSAERKS